MLKPPVPEEQKVGDVLADRQAAPPEDRAMTQALKGEIQQLLDSILKPRERLVLQLRFGLDNGQAHSLKDQSVPSFLRFHNLPLSASPLV